MFNIAIDGPAGAGKSTAARLSAEKLGFIYVDTGALYRAVGIRALALGISTADSENVLNMLPGIKIDLAFEDGVQKVFLNGEDVSSKIRLPEASMAASEVSAIPGVRAFLLELQRTLARENDCLMDGRDIGTVILPDAGLKIFLTASPEVRAKRRYDELTAKGHTVDFDALLAEIKQRDYNDSHREIAPLKPAPDSVYLDTSEMTAEEVVDTVVSLARERMLRQ